MAWKDFLSDHIKDELGKSLRPVLGDERYEQYFHLRQSVVPNIENDVSLSEFEVRASDYWPHAGPEEQAMLDIFDKTYTQEIPTIMIKFEKLYPSYTLLKTFWSLKFNKY